MNSAAARTSSRRSLSVEMLADPKERDIVVEALLRGAREVVLDGREGAGRRNGTGHGAAILLVVLGWQRKKRPSLVMGDGR